MRKTRPKGRNVKKRKTTRSNRPEPGAIRYITEDEYAQLLTGARAGRYPQRDALIVQLLYQHGFRATELIRLKRADIKIEDARIFVRRLKGSLSTEQPLAGTTLRTLRAHFRARLAHVHPHMLRHGCGFALANKGRDTRLIQDYLGHKDIKNTVVYTRTAAKRFEELWDD